MQAGVGQAAAARQIGDLQGMGTMPVDKGIQLGQWQLLGQWAGQRRVQAG